MAGITLEEARAAQEAACNAQRNGPSAGRPHNARNAAKSANTANSANAMSTQSTPGDQKTTFTLNGKSYMLLPNNASTSTSQIVEIVEANNVLSAISMLPCDEAEYLAVIATADKP